MIGAGDFMAAAAGRGYTLYTGVPCSYLTPFINAAIDAPGLRYVPAANEGDAVAIAAGAALAGRRAVAMFQNSGLGNAVNPLTSLTWTFRIPVLLVVTWRAEPGGAADEPQHELMGPITPRLLELMEIPWQRFPAEPGAVAPALEAADASMARTGLPYAFVMQKGSVADVPLSSGPRERLPDAPVPPGRPVASATRTTMLRALQAATGAGDVVIATTGYTGRELAALDDRPNQLYMVGSMGCAVSLGLGLAIARPDLRIVVLDGDGAALMRLGALTTVGFERPPNLVHVVLDNGRHESTGGQATVSGCVDFPALAAASGYPDVTATGSPESLQALLADRRPGLRFIHVPTLPGVPAGLPRPTVRPPAVAERLRAYLAGGGVG
jgi:phosphonopyruvate decarboxylase